MSESVVKNKRIEEGVYELSYKGNTTKIVRRPDLYFDLEIDGVKHKGYIKDLKTMYANWIDTGEISYASRAGAAKAPKGAAVAPPPPAAEEPADAAVPAQGQPLAPALAEARKARRKGFQTVPVPGPIVPARAYAPQWHRKDKATGKLSYEKGIEVFAKLANGGYDDVYPNVRTAMAQATKEAPLESKYAFYWPVIPGEK